MATNVGRGAALKAAREAKPWTQAQLAAAAGVSTRTVIRAELGGDATAETLLALCGALGIDSGSLPPPAETPGEEEAPNETVAPDLDEHPVSRRPRNRAWLRRALSAVGLACMCAGGWHVGWSGGFAYGLRDAPTLQSLFENSLAVSLAKDMAVAAASVAEGSPSGTGSWDAIFTRRSPFSIGECPNLGFFDFLTWNDSGSCRPNPSPPRVSVAAAGPGLVDVTVGPMQPPALRDLARMLPRDPRLSVTASYRRAPEDGRWGSLRFDPASLAYDQVPLPVPGPAYLNVRIEPRGGIR